MLGLLIGTVRPIPGQCANRMSIFVEKESVAIPFREFAEHVEGLSLHLGAIRLSRFNLT